MTVSELQEIYADNLYKVFDRERFRHLADHSSNIQNYSFINRLLIYIQNSSATNVNTDDYWQIRGRLVKNEAKPIYILDVVQNTRYIDCETGEEVGQSELTPFELKKAIDIGMISKEVDIVELKCGTIYDIADTEEIEAKQEQTKDSNIETRKFKLSALLNLSKSMGLVVEKSENNETSFEINTNTLRIGSDSIEDKVTIIVEALIRNLISSTTSTLDIFDSDLELVIWYACYSVLTYFGIETTISLENMSLSEDDDRQDSIVTLLEVTEQFIQEYIFKAEDKDNPSDGIRSISNEKAKRAATLLSILEANYQACGGSNVVK